MCGYEALCGVCARRRVYFKTQPRIEPSYTGFRSINNNSYILDKNVWENSTPAFGDNIILPYYSQKNFSFYRAPCIASMGSEKKIVPDSRRAWMTLCTVIFSLFASGGLQMSFGTILGALVQEFGESKSKTGKT